MEGNQSEGHKEGAIAEQGKLGGLMVFNHNHHFAYIYKKTEKLVTAVYMITNFIKDGEPLKWKIREKALSLLELNMSFNTVSLAERRSLLKDYQAHSIEIVSLASIAQHSGLISEMNFNVLSREFNGLVSTMEKDENKKANEETVILNPDFFDTPRTTHTTHATHASHTPHTHTPVQAAAPIVPTHNVLYKGHEQKPVAHALRPVKDTHIKDPKDSKDDRQGTILKLLSKQSGLGIKDFVGSIKGVSEKTIQRELLAMVAAGTIKKEGERRWSTYSIA
ncbi:MAG: hypothetical protein Q8L64_06275 [bacterium]|nr:hypothetical protein [bacterium]